MTAASVPQQLIAAFALHAVWQVPALALAAWLALRVGKPGVRTAHAAWVVTLLLCVCAPFGATWQGYRNARAAGETNAFFIRYGTSDVADTGISMHREAAWLRVLHRHVSLTHAPTPIAYRLPEWLARDVAGAYLLLLLLACVRLGLSLHRSRVLLRSSSTEVPQEVVAAVAVRAEQMGCAAPLVACSDAVAGPLLVGTMVSTLLLPAWAAAMTTEEMDAVLAHELAHVSRRDPAWHAVCSVLLLPVRFHPVAGWIASRVRQTREMACDAAAAEQMGSTSRYAHALLRVAERVLPSQRGAIAAGLGLFDTAAPIRDGRLYTATRPATAGLELFGAHGAMEERMHTMVTANRTMSVAGRVVRGSAAVLIAVAGVTAAWSLRVQPVLAAPIQNAEVPLAGGSDAQQQLRAASRRLRDAAASATTAADREKFGAAQEAIRIAQVELRAQSAPEGLRALDSGLGTLDVRLQPQMEELQQKLNSPEFRARIEKQRADVQAMRLEFESPEFKAQIQKQVEEAKRMSAQWNQPEFRARIEKQRADAQAMRLKFDSPEFKAQIQKQVEESTRAVAETNAQMSLMAKTEPFSVFPAPLRDDQPVRVSAGVMATANLTKAVPVYPVSAKQAKIQGEVVLHVIVDERGAVEQVTLVSSPDDALTQSATEAVRKWTYKPFLVNGNPTPVDTTVTVHFSLGQ